MPEELNYFTCKHCGTANVIPSSQPSGIPIPCASCGRAKTIDIYREPFKVRAGRIIQVMAVVLVIILVIAALRMVIIFALDDPRDRGDRVETPERRTPAPAGSAEQRLREAMPGYSDEQYRDAAEQIERFVESQRQR